jgi:hypothetical protein
VGDLAAGLVLFVAGTAGALNWRGYLLRFNLWMAPPQAPVPWLPWWRNYDRVREAQLMTRWFRVFFAFFALCGAVLSVRAAWHLLPQT